MRVCSHSHVSWKGNRCPSGHGVWPWHVMHMCRVCPHGGSGVLPYMCRWLGGRRWLTCVHVRVLAMWVGASAVGVWVGEWVGVRGLSTGCVFAHPTLLMC